MAHIELTWINTQRYLAVDSTGHSVVLSAPNDIGVKPSETLLIALAACSAHDVVEIINKQRVPLEHLSITVTGEQAPEPPWAYQRIHMHFRVQAVQLRQEQLERAIDLSLNKYCSVRASLSPDIVVTCTAEIQGAT